MDRSYAIAVVVALGLVGLGLAAWPSTPEAPPLQLVSAGARQSVTVHVSGAVAQPGLVELDRSARIADAIVAAGGALPGADLGGLNLAAGVGEGSRVVVPSGSDTMSAAAGDGLVRVNAASTGELESLPGVGPVLAQRIVAYRDAHGSFQAVEDLLEVPGIGEAKLEGLRDGILVP